MSKAKHDIPHGVATEVEGPIACPFCQNPGIPDNQSRDERLMFYGYEVHLVHFMTGQMSFCHRHATMQAASMARVKAHAEKLRTQAQPQ
jgi:hypothetical protein